LALNSAALPEAGTVWRIRDGLSATTPGPAGDNRRLAAMVQAIEGLGTSNTTGATRHFAGHIADVQSLAAVRQIEAERRQSFAAAQLEGLTVRVLQGGVDTDEQMQRLLLIQQSYAANARVIETVGTLLDTLIRI
jgi:flagellar hook-associated protein 1 FlgK